ncbi:MAG: glucose-6-phosphate isomerase, partial [Burkholderiales bacterium]|nr:glucose-6-phosphate isomerase [Burkholderiales bacterium]
MPLRTLFADDAGRVPRFTVEGAGLTLDLSRQRIDPDCLSALLAYAAAVRFDDRRAAMRRGDIVNPTEGRRAWHTALRTPPGPQQPEEVAACLARMTRFARAVREGSWTGERGQRITDVVNIGIGGSHLGPQMACEALERFTDPALRVHFLSNVDPAAWLNLRARLDPDRTLVIVASKSWKTLETARNMEAALQWLRAAGITEAGLAQHLAGVTAAPDLAAASGIGEQTLFPFWDWVGGRYSLWSAIGLPVMLAIGHDHFNALLAGAHAMDSHFAQTDAAHNLPLMLALTAFWNRLLDPGATEVIAPYCDPLRRLPAYLQQLQMESNGKSVTNNGEQVSVPTAPIVWGAAGTDAQHAFLQLLHQGTVNVPVDFILVARAAEPFGNHQDMLFANGVAQAEALAFGLTSQEVADSGEEAALIPHKTFPGNHPSSVLMIESLNPFTLGQLLSLYEHKVAIQGFIWG